MSQDLFVLLTWWLTWLGAGVVGMPISYAIFSKWHNKGYIFAKAIGAFGTAYVMWVLGSLHILKFGTVSILISALVVFGAGILLAKLFKLSNPLQKKNLQVWVLEELMFFVVLTFWTWIKAHEPTINGLEKFMDFGFVKSILRSEYFPPADIWFAGQPINYYYFGHLMLAGMTKISGLDLGFTFNLILATLCALCFTSSWTIGHQILKNFSGKARLFGALLIAFLVTFSGNLHTIYNYTNGYSFDSDTPPPFWEIWASQLRGDAPAKTEYWYPNATRFIPYTIHEFPSYSFVVSDIHGHVLSIPLALLAIGLLVQIFVVEEKIKLWLLVAYGVVLGWLFTTNALDGPIYLGLFGLIYLGKIITEQGNKDLFRLDTIKPIITKLAVVAVVFGATTMPFTLHFDSFVTGLGVNCPPAFLAFKGAAGVEGMNKIGPFIFETVNKCQKSPVWMMLILWGMFVYAGVIVFRQTQKDRLGTFMRFGTIACAGLILFAEFFYFKDIYPMHFRSNTMFKLGYQAFIFMSILAGYAFTLLISKKRWLPLLVGLPLLILVSIYPYFAVKSYFGELKTYRGIYGLNWLNERLPDDKTGIDWLNTNINSSQQPVVLEANGDSYTDFERVSVFTGLPTIAGWTVHEWLWRGSYTPIANRAEEVSKIYQGKDKAEVLALLKKYKVVYIVIGDMERQKYTEINEDLIKEVSTPVFIKGGFTIYKLL